MDVQFTSQDVFVGKHDAAILFTYEGRSPTEARFDERMGKQAQQARARQDFKGAKDERLIATGGQPRLCALVGLGSQGSVTIAGVREACGAAVIALQDMGARHIAIEVPAELDAEAIAQAVTEGAMLAAYRYTKYKRLKTLDAITIASDRSGVAARRGVEFAKTVCAAVNAARDLQNAPPAELYPQAFADEVIRVGKEHKLKTKILDAKTLEKQGYGAIVAVGSGSAHPPCIATIEHAPKGAKKTICLVGKGITFDTGGYCIKPSEPMRGMKFDMSGAAAVLMAVRAASDLKLPIRVVGVMGLAENSISGDAYKPDDIVRTKAGKTIEIENTDAEGRLVLADCLAHAQEYTPDIVIDLATLTGAVVVALGDVAAGLFSNDQALADALKSAAKRSGERVWQLPLWDEYRKDIDSKVADMKNMGVPKTAGSIAGAMLLWNFVDTPWAHLDIAGVAWSETRGIYFTRDGEGGTGFGVRLLIEYLRSL